LNTDTGSALLTHKANVTFAQKRYDLKLWPVGKAFDTWETLLMDSEGVFYVNGDAGMLKFRQGFEETVGVLVRDQGGKVWY
jgi:hypothetical protein